MPYSDVLGNVAPTPYNSGIVGKGGYTLPLHDVESKTHTSHRKGVIQK